MNVDEESVARRLLEAIAVTNEVFRQDMVEIGRLRGVAKAIFSCEVVKYATASALEAYLDAELKDGNGISWLLEVNWTDAEWKVQRKLVKSTSAGQDTIKELPTKTFSQFHQLVESLPNLATELTALRTSELNP